MPQDRGFLVSLLWRSTSLLSSPMFCKTTCELSSSSLKFFSLTINFVLSESLVCRVAVPCSPWNRTLTTNSDTREIKIPQQSVTLPWSLSVLTLLCCTSSSTSLMFITRQSSDIWGERPEPERLLQELDFNHIRYDLICNDLTSVSCCSDWNRSELTVWTASRSLFWLMFSSSSCRTTLRLLFFSFSCCKWFDKL